MKLGKGTVKKYKREYTRTLKNGEKKKYSTEQIQVNVPKQYNIYENGEEVYIIPGSEKETIENLDEILASYEISNYLLNEQINNLEIENSNEDEILSLKEENEILLNENTELNEKFSQSEADFEVLESEYNNLAEKYNSLIERLEYLENKERYNTFVNRKIKRFILNKD